MKILIGYDGSNASKDALNLGIRHAKAFGGKLYVIRSMIGGDTAELEQIEQSRQELNYVEELCRERDVPCETHLLIRGFTPGEDIVKFAAENDMDEIVIGVRRRSKVGKMIFGYTAQVVILEAPCPVLSVK